MTKRKQKSPKQAIAQAKQRFALRNDFVVGAPTPAGYTPEQVAEAALKVFLELVALVKASEDTEFETVTLSPPAFWERFFGYQHRPTIPEIARLVGQCGGAVRVVQDGPEIKPILLFGQSSYNVDDGLMRVRLSDALKPYALRLKSYTYGMIASVRRLRGAYAIWLYLFLRRYAQLCKDEIVVPLPALFAALGISPKVGAAREWRRLRQHILEPVQAQIEQKTELRFKFSAVREGGEKRQRGNVHAVRFYEIDIVSNNGGAEEDAQLPADAEAAPPTATPDTPPRQQSREPDALDQARDRIKQALAEEAGQHRPVDPLHEHYDPYAD